MIMVPLTHITPDQFFTDLIWVNANKKTW